MTEPFVTFKPEFIATKYPGYFFNIQDKQLYSMKISGVLKPLKFRKPNQWNNMYRWQVTLKNGDKIMTGGGYQVSVRGRTKYMLIEELMDIEPTKSVVPTWKDK